MDFLLLGVAAFLAGFSIGLPTGALEAGEWTCNGLVPVT